jgi:predicted chitinase
MKKLIVTLKQVNQIIEENFKKRLFEAVSKIEQKSDFQSVGKGGANKPEDVKHILDLFSNEKVGMAKEVQDVINKCSPKSSTSSDSKSPSELLDTADASETSTSSDIDYAAIGKCTEFHNLIADYQKEKVFSGFSDSRIDADQGTIGSLYGSILGMANIKAANTASITSFNTNEKLVFDALKEKGFTDEGAAAVMGVAAGESGFKGFKEFSYIKTPNSSIRAIFSSKAAILSDETLNKMKADENTFDEKFFNIVYGGMYGNAPDEGYKYVGRGFNGITFKANYEAAQNCTSIGFVGNPELMEKPENAAPALACYFNVGAIKNSNNLETAFQ